MTSDLSMLWQDMTRSEIATARDRGALVAIPIGAVEQHASHLPVDTDIRLATAVTRLAASQAQRVPVLVAPGLAYGFSPHHLSHAGTVTFRLSTYLTLLGEIANSFAATGFRRIVFVNGHGGNSAPLRSKIAELVTDGIAVTGVDYWTTSEADWLPLLKGQTKRFGHACEFETSLMLAVCDEHLRASIMSKIGGLAPRPLQPWVPSGESEDCISAARAAWPPVFQGDDAGYHGDPGAATLETGNVILPLIARRLAGFFDDFAAAPIRVGNAARESSPRLSAPIISKLAE